LSIKSKQYPVPPADDLPPYAEDCLCWGCDRLFDMMEIMKDGLCRKCWKIVKIPAPSG